MSRWAENSFRKITLWATYRETEAYTPEWMVEAEGKEWYKLQSTDFISLLQGTVLLPQTSQIPLRTFHFWKLVSKNRSTIEAGVDYNICSPYTRTVSIYFCKKSHTISYEDTEIHSRYTRKDNKDHCQVSLVKAMT